MLEHSYKLLVMAVAGNGLVELLHPRREGPERGQTAVTGCIGAPRNLGCKVRSAWLSAWCPRRYSVLSLLMCVDDSVKVTRRGAVVWHSM